MCGIFGVFSTTPLPPDMLALSNRIQAHRGPNGVGADELKVGAWNVGLSHQRLAIIDLNARSNQPFKDAHNRYLLTYNGEIYNYKEIRKELEQQGVQFTTEGDTEVLFNALITYGIEKALPKLNGMWAFCFIDLKEQMAYLCRDEYGIKPLYYTNIGNRLCFSSEIKTLLGTAGHTFKLNERIAGQFLYQSLTDGDPEETLYQGVLKVPAGCFLQLNLKTPELKVQKILHYQLKIQSNFAQMSLDDSIHLGRELFEDAIKIRLRSDVPVGILLSGGLDSSSITTMAQQILTDKSDLTLLSVVSDSPRHDESFFIDQMASYLKRDVHKIQIHKHKGQMVELLSTVNYHNDGPVSTLSTVAHYLLMQEAKRLGITVIQSGQGADELLCGYKKYLGLYVMSLLRGGNFLSAGRTLWGFLGNTTFLKQFSLKEAKRYIRPPKIFQGTQVSAPKALAYHRENLALQSGQDLRARQISDVTHYSIPALLHTEDRMSMSASRELRVPFLDKRLVEFFISLPVSQKIRSGHTKYVMRKIMEKNLPPTVCWRRDKLGFTVPEDQWIKGELKEAVGATLHPKARVFELGFLDYQTYRNQYEQFGKPGRAISFDDLFIPYSFENWIKRFETNLSF